MAWWRTISRSFRGVKRRSAATSSRVRSRAQTVMQRLQEGVAEILEQHSHRNPALTTQMGVPTLLFKVRL